jgi:hypothetical protein
MEFKVGQKIKVDGVEAEILGVIRYYSYTEYLILMDGKEYWLEQGRGCKLWVKTKAPFDAKRFAEVLSPDSVDTPNILGKKMGKGLIVREVCCAQAQYVSGRVDGVKSGDTVTCVEGDIQKKGERQNFPFFAAEIWGDEIEFFEGRATEVITQ